jgi:hypothetical protein
MGVAHCPLQVGDKFRYAEGALPILDDREGARCQWAVWSRRWWPGKGPSRGGDQVRVKYEMLRARLVDGLPASEVAGAQGYSWAAFWWRRRSISRGSRCWWASRAAAVARSRYGPRSWTLSAPAPGRGPQIAEQVGDRFGVRLHRRTIEWVRPR